MPLDLGFEISKLKDHPEIGQYLASALERIESSMNHTGRSIGVDPTGQLAAPPQIQKLDIAHDGNGTVHATISDSGSVERPIHYFLEYSNEPTFRNPTPIHLGASRSSPPLTLPAKDSNGNAQVYYFQAYHQYPGGLPSKPIKFGGITPMAVDPGGNGQLTLPSSTGSGTAQNLGEDQGFGFGKFLIRLKSLVKRGNT